jgi:hypothetical protein
VLRVGAWDSAYSGWASLDFLTPTPDIRMLMNIPLRMRDIRMARTPAVATSGGARRSLGVAGVASGSAASDRSPTQRSLTKNWHRASSDVVSPNVGRDYHRAPAASPFLAAETRAEAMSITRSVGLGLLLAATMAASVPIAAQAQQDQNILFIMRNDIDLLQPSIYHPPFQIPGFRRGGCCRNWRCWRA